MKNPESFSTGFVQVMENWENHGMKEFYFAGLKSPGIYLSVMENHGKL